jgi:hypothetical protein
MRAWVGILPGLVVSCWTATVCAETYFKYRDTSTGCDAFVGRADLIPRKLRDGARAVTAGEMRKGRIDSEACVRNRQRQARLEDDGMRRDARLAAGAIDARLTRSDGRFLTDAEIEDLKKLSNPMVSAYVLACLAALVAWISVMVAAFREDHLGWAMLMLFLSAPMAIVYLFTGLGKGRGRFKAACALGMLSPLLVFLASVWRLFAMTHGQGHV